MALGLGGIVASALAGGVSGAGQGLATDAIEQQKQQALALQAQQLASLNQQTYTANLASKAASDLVTTGPQAAATAKAASDNVATTAATQATITGAVDDAKAQSAAEAPLTNEQILRGTERDAANKRQETYQKQMADAATERAAAATTNASTRSDGTSSKPPPADVWTVRKTDSDGNITSVSKLVPGVMMTSIQGQDAVPPKPGDTLGNLTGGLIGNKAKPGVPAVNPDEKYFFGGKEISVDQYQTMLAARTGKSAALPASSSPSTSGPVASGGKTVTNYGTDDKGKYGPVGGRVALFSDGSVGPVPAGQ